MPRRILLLQLLSLLTAACGPVAPPPRIYINEPDCRKQEYVIGASDVLSVDVWNNPNVSRAGLTVRPDGTITLPLIGDIRTDGRTPTELQEEIRQKLQKFVKDQDAIVTVAVTEPNAYRFTVSGNVDTPGVYTSQRCVTVLEAVTLAGGANRYGNTERITIERRDKRGKARRIPINLKLITSGKRPDMNIWILPGDIILVP